jgi:Icc-related predicted phosphoesterase
MKILYVTDLHGSEWKYDRVFQFAQKNKIDIVINGGDMYPKNKDLFSQDPFITGYLDNHFGIFDAAGINYLCYPGNDDLMIFEPQFEEICQKYSHVSNIAQRRIKIGGYEFIGMNWVVDYPFRLKDRCRMDTEKYIFQKQLGSGILSTPNGWKEIDNWFEYAKSLPTIEDEMNLLIKPNDMRKAIYVIHMPPAKLGLDVCVSRVKVGSQAIYNFLMKNQPLISLHGHIHESPEISGSWYAKLNNTLCIQPGQLMPLTYVIIDLKTMDSKRYQENE